MVKHKLASELRECQRRLGQAPDFFIESLPDEAIIDAYVTCHDCQTRLVDDDTLEKCISEAKDYEDFLALVNGHNRSILTRDGEFQKRANEPTSDTNTNGI